MGKYCSSCGSQMAQDEKFCAICGTKFESNVRQSIPQISQDQSSDVIRRTATTVRVKKIRLIIGLLLILYGIIFSSIFINQENKQNRENTVVEATVTSCVMTYEEYDIVDGGYDREYRIGVKYTYNGENYESSIDYSSEKSIGKKIKIHINPNNPIETDGMYGGLTDYIATILFGVIPFVLAGVFLVISAFKTRECVQQKSV